MKPTGNGRRQSYAHVPMPRMTNTYSWRATGSRGNPASVRNGIYAANFGGGQGRHHLGQYVSSHEAYKIENGKLGRAAEGRHADRQRPDRPASHHHGRQRPLAR